MTCAAAEPWMLASRTADELPERVRRHLAQCPRCAARFALLVRVDGATAGCAPAPNPAARARLDARLARTPHPAARPATEPTPTPSRTRHNVPRWVIGLAAAVMLASGWLAGRFTAPRPVAQVPAPDRAPPPAPQPLPLAPPPAPAPGLLAKVARQSSRVATDPTPAAQADALYQIAADVRADATRRAAAGDVEPVPRLIGLHDRVLKLGVAHQLRRVPEAQRAAATAEMVAALNRSADEVAAAAGRLPPAVGDSLRPLAASCREAGAALQQGKPAAADEWPAPATPLEALAAHTIRLGNAAAPLARADEAAQLAAVLSQAVTVLAVGDFPDDAARVGEALDAVLGRGVAANLERVEAADPAGTRRDEVAKVRARADRATEALERNLAKAPPAARTGLERALAASAAGRDKAAGKPDKPHGPPWKKGDGEHPGKGKGAPPGWQKKP